MNAKFHILLPIFLLQLYPIFLDMRSLIQSLEKILNGWKEDREEVLEFLKPGLTDDEIKKRFSWKPLVEAEHSINNLKK